MCGDHFPYGRDINISQKLPKERGIGFGLQFKEVLVEEWGGYGHRYGSLFIQEGEGQQKNEAGL